MCIFVLERSLKSSRKAPWKSLNFKVTEEVALCLYYGIVYFKGMKNRKCSCSEFVHAVAHQKLLQSNKECERSFPSYDTDILPDSMDGRRWHVVWQIALVVATSVIARIHSCLVGVFYGAICASWPWMSLRHAPAVIIGHNSTQPLWRSVAWHLNPWRLALAVSPHSLYIICRVWLHDLLPESSLPGFHLRQIAASPAVVTIDSGH